ESQEGHQSQSQPYRELAATHIRELSDIKERIPTIVQQAAFAVSQLTNKPLDIPAKNPPGHVSDSVPSRIEIIKRANDDLLAVVQQLRTDLHAQVDALANEGVIPTQQTIKHAPVLQGQNQAAQDRQHDPEATVTNEGLGNLDVGNLNARAGVREVKGEEALTRVKEVLEELAKSTQGGDEMAVE
ncbi:hypothetical protein BS50DRAFT_457858, partial [Corynespora cassiicola Philippines]